VLKDNCAFSRLSHNVITDFHTFVNKAVNHNAHIHFFIKESADDAELLAVLT
jgi:hypothetical protein